MLLKNTLMCYNQKCFVCRIKSKINKYNERNNRFLNMRLWLNYQEKFLVMLCRKCYLLAYRDSNTSSW